MNLSLNPWTIAPAVVVLTVALVSRIVGFYPGRLAQISSRWAPLFVATLILLGMWVYEGRFEPLPFVFAILFGCVGPGEPKSETVPPRAGGNVAIALLLGAVSAAVTFWVWQGKGFSPLFHDESAYLLQAGIFAEGRWTDPSPPIPEFFEQFHVLVVPTRAAKYPPGHALALAPGVALGIPGAVPLLLVAGTATLLFVLTRRLAGPRGAILGWLVWTSAPGLFGYRSSYFSELTTSFLWLAVWWAILRWRETERPLWLAAAAFGSAWGAITRPLTMLLFVIPLVFVLSRPLMRRRRHFGELALAAAVGVIPLLILPLWSFRTVGSWSMSPLASYTRAYLPFDRIGFGVDERQPERSLPDCMQGLPRLFRRIHRNHVSAVLPQILAERVTNVLRDAFGGPRSLLFVFALLGATRLRREGIVAVVTAVLLFLGYLVYAHPSEWSLYYFETQPVMAAAAGIGIVAALSSLPDGLARLAGSLLVVAITSLFFLDASKARAQASRSGPRSATLHAALAYAPKRDPIIVFVRCRPGADPHESLVQNGPDLQHARRWLVHDLEMQNARLWKLAPERRAFLYDESVGLLQELDPLAAASSAPAQ